MAHADLARRFAVTLALGGACSPVVAVVPYDLQLVVRTGAGALPSFNIPLGSSVSSATPSLNDLGKLAIKLTSPNSLQEIWYGDAAGGFQAHSIANLIISDASVNNDGRIVWTDERDWGVWSLVAGSGSPALYLTAGATSSWTSAQIGHDGRVVARASQAGLRTALGFLPPSTSFTYASEGSGVSFLFTPLQNDAGQIAAKVLLSSGPASDPNEVRRYGADGSFVTIARDNGAELASPYDSFFNNLGISENGWVAFNARKLDGTRTVVAGNGTETRVIADPSLPMGDPRREANPTESFNMGVSNGGVVVFRAFDRNNRRALWAGDGVGLRRIVTELDTVQTDLGPAIVRWPGGGSPAFSGSPDMNRRGQVAFGASLINPANQSQQWGIAIFVATPAAGDANGDGLINLDDFLILASSYELSMGDPGYDGRADFNFDGRVDLDDFLLLAANYERE